MINLHCHTYYSDGVLGPAELICRCIELNYEAVGISDHSDESNFENNIKSLKRVTDEFNKKEIIRAICGVELTYVLPENIDRVALECKKIGADIVVVHGETIVEPVPPNTNFYAVQSKNVDILAHPGFISEEEVILAKQHNVLLEITSRKGHSLTNGYVGGLAMKNGTGLILSTDAHGPEDLITHNFGLEVLRGAGLTEEIVQKTLNNAEKLVSKIFIK